jgi:hypothetical protein
MAKNCNESCGYVVAETKEEGRLPTWQFVSVLRYTKKNTELGDKLEVGDEVKVISGSSEV